MYCTIRHNNQNHRTNHNYNHHHLTQIKPQSPEHPELKITITWPIRTKNNNHLTNQHQKPQSPDQSAFYECVESSLLRVEWFSLLCFLSATWKERVEKDRQTSLVSRNGKIFSEWESLLETRGCLLGNRIDNGRSSNTAYTDWACQQFIPLKIYFNKCSILTIF